jgi:hypothetical protein
MSAPFSIERDCSNVSAVHLPQEAECCKSSALMNPGVDPTAVSNKVRFFAGWGMALSESLVNSSQVAAFQASLMAIGLLFRRQRFFEKV